MKDKPHLLDQMRERIRLKHYSIRTECVYCEWVKRLSASIVIGSPEEVGIDSGRSGSVGP